MRALVQTRFGPPDRLELRDVPVPAVEGDQLLVRVHAASLNSWDWDRVIGSFPARLERLRGAYRLLGADVAGTVEAVGPEVTRFRPGDDVFGDLSEAGWGSLAELARGSERFFAHKPAAISFNDAATLPQAGTLALQGLFGSRPVRAGDHVLVNGGGGGMGTFAIQIAKHAGALVTAIDRAEKQTVMREAGADRVFDYATLDYTRAGERYDLVLDPVARHRAADYRRVLKPGGALVVIGGKTGTLLRIALRGLFGPDRSGRRMGLLLWRPMAASFEEMAALVEAGAVRPVIDRVADLAEAPAALADLGAGRVRGKVVVTLR